MRQVTVIKTYGTFEELSKERQIKELDKRRYDYVQGDLYYECIVDDFKECLKLLGFSDIQLRWSGFCSQGDGASWSGVFEKPDNIIENIDKIKKDYAYMMDIFDFVKFAHAQVQIIKEANIDFSNDRYCHEHTMHCDDSRLFELWAKQVARNLYKELEKSYEYYTSDEFLKEQLIDTEVEFLINEVESEQ